MPVNGSAFAVYVLLGCSAAELLATRVGGEATIGMLAMLVQGVLLVWTATRYDRHANVRPTPREIREENR